jgi:hypothetical protein
MIKIYSTPLILATAESGRLEEITLTLTQAVTAFNASLTLAISS